MTPIFYRRGLIRIAEVWLEESDEVPAADVVHFIGASRPMEGIFCEPFSTLTVALDLANTDLIMQQMEKNTRYEIRRAEARDNLGYEYSMPHTLDELADFVRVYRSNILEQNHTVRLNLKRLRSMTESGILDLSVMRHAQGWVLSWHVHVVGRNIARLLHSVSPLAENADQSLKSLRGRANRLHHWMDMRRFQEHGCSLYDFGGYYSGQSDEKKLRINQFKSGFGGNLTHSFNCLCAQTGIGRVALRARNLLRGKSWPAM